MCNGDPLFTYLEDDQIQVIVKGTYASNDPRDWDTSMDFDDDDIDVLYYGSIDHSQLDKFYLDIAEIRANGDKFANYRETFGINLTDTDAFFDGTGVAYKNDDLFPDDSYDELQVYIRKMIFNNTYQYDWDGSAWDTNSAEATEVFYTDGNVEGYNCNLRQIYTYYDELRMDEDDDYDPDNRIFPLEVPIIPEFTFESDQQYVIELRFVIKNFVKRYVYHEGTDEDDDRVNYYGMSDYIWDVNAGEKYIGGNLFAVARAYIPGKTAAIRVTAGNGLYVIAIPASEDIADYQISRKDRTALGDYSSNSSTWDSYNTTVQNFKIPPIAAWKESGTYIDLKNVPEGDYKVYTGTCNVREIPTSFTQLGGTVTISESDFGGYVTVNP
jgi:hypothetical protein